MSVPGPGLVAGGYQPVSGELVEVPNHIAVDFKCLCDLAEVFGKGPVPARIFMQRDTAATQAAVMFLYLESDITE